MLDHRHYVLAAAYAFGSVTAGYLAIFGSTVLTRRIRLRP
jgi:hypothetical protein